MTADRPKPGFGMMTHPCRDLFVCIFMMAGIYTTLIDAYRSIIGPESISYTFLAVVVAMAATLWTMGSIFEQIHNLAAKAAEFKVEGVR